ncbi:acyl-CoA dehydrogenase family protein [Rhizorhabdus wittichii]|jgi:alkylation response protein AidB-like acyl-CoA dehydrogenase|uniref:Acyl-CoA dehydrogenase n=1 Tax=Rhizorhabdus wittichii TaxID=160791 RepID=A0A975HC43_9SPHN|nr:acyl-CoA dehydrogenase family protein [Rhizorhabdus wittichii]QTH20055.1 acyl-CoA dehydrogenase [Rhizorhabdus wittichii]
MRADLSAPTNDETQGAAEVLARVRALVPALKDLAEITERERRVSAETTGLLRETGVHRLLQPRRFGGLEANFSDLVKANMELGRGCASTAWCTSIAAIHNWIVALYPLEAQEEVWADPRNIVAGSYMPAGTCERVAGGYRIGGAWSFASNCDNSQWFIVGAMLPPEGEGGPPQVGWFLLPRQDAEVVDTWYSMGMSGTGSKTISIERPVFVPSHRVMSIAQVNSTAAPGTAVHGNPLYRLTFAAAAPSMLISPALGAAQGAVEDFDTLAQSKMSAQAGGPPAPMKSLANNQIAIATAAASVDAARLMILTDLAEMERTLAAGGLPDMDQRLRHRRNHGFAGQLASTAVNGLFEALGANGGALSNPVQRAWRDINVAVRHISLHWPATAAMYGQHRFGLPPKGQF